MIPEAIAKSKKTYIWATPLFLLMAVTYYVYLPGTYGLFIFDDFPNISSIGKYTNLGYWDNFWLYLLEGKAGPTGRPISLASFYFNASHWPAKPSGFLYTNIFIHLFNGLLIFWISTKLSKLTGLPPSQQLFFSLLASAIWLLHPMHTTTVLYIVQRMTELSATFILTGILFYLYGREKLTENKKSALLLLFIGVGGSLLLSILSKENGILLVAYILVIEFFLLQAFKNYPPKTFYYWLIPTVIVPFTGIIIYLGLHTNPDAFNHRNFTLTERLLSEPRILFDYLQNILLPRIGTNTIFHDDYLISTSLFDPLTTLPALVGIFILAILSIALRKKQPFIAFAIAWFFAGHLIESTVLPLELYFEHRNYLPIFGIFAGLAYYTSTLLNTHKIIILSVSGVLLSLFAFLVLQNATLWGKPAEQAYFWYKNHPNSLRTREVYRPFAQAQEVNMDGVTEKESRQQKSSQFYSTLSLLNLTRACATQHITTDDLASTVRSLQNHTIHSTVSLGLKSFINEWKKGSCTSLKFKDIEHFLLALTAIEKVQRNSNFLFATHYFLSEVYRENKDFNNTMIHLDKAYQYQPRYDLLKERANTLASGGLLAEAIKVLDDTSNLKQGFRENLALRIKQKELDMMKAELTHSLSSTNIN